MTASARAAGGATMTDADTPRKAGWTKVWDPFIRVGHWVLLAAVATALITRGEPELLHQAAGYVIAAYVVWRIVWGIAGPPNARFEGFLQSPIAAARYVIDLIRGKAQRHVGHSPAGGWMVLALLIALSGTVMTGLAMENRVAPPALLAPLISQDADEVDESGRAGGEEESPWEEIHEALANLVLALALLHVVGVAVASIAHRENLVRAMVDGKKRTEE